MKWHERNAGTIEMAIFFLIVLGIFGIVMCNLFLATKSYGASCLTVDVPSQAVIGVMDGDTFSVFNLLPPGYVRVRVEGVNTPEKNTPGFTEAREFTVRWLASGSFTLRTCGKHTFERIVGVVERNGVTLADELRQAGHAKP